MTRRSRTRLAAITAVLLLFLTACGASGEPTGYDQQFTADGVAIEEDNFMRACTAIGQANDELDAVRQAGLESTCRCGWTEIRATLTFEEFDNLDDNLRDDQNAVIPESLQTILTDCIRNS